MPRNEINGGVNEAEKRPDEPNPVLEPGASQAFLVLAEVGRDELIGLANQAQSSLYHPVEKAVGGVFRVKRRSCHEVGERKKAVFEIIKKIVVIEIYPIFTI
jgi:hypothetical protein